MLGLTVCDPFLARTTVYDPFLFGGFSVVSMKVKIWAIHVQWARCLVCCPVSLVHFLYFSFEDCLGASSLDILLDLLALTPVLYLLSFALFSLVGVLWMRFFGYWLLFWSDHISGLCYFHEVVLHLLCCLKIFLLLTVLLSLLL